MSELEKKAAETAENEEVANAPTEEQTPETEAKTEENPVV